MEQTLTMSTKERERIKILHQIKHGTMTKAAAATCLGISERQMFRLWSRYQTEGDEGIIHRLRGCRSNRGYSLKIRSLVGELFQTQYADYGPTLFSEMLEQHHRITVARETLRRWLMRKGLWSGVRKKRLHRKRRERRLAIGAMVQFDGSDHAWFEERGPRCCLLVAIDDASGRVFLRFVKSESTDSVLMFWCEYIQRSGIPREVYTDRGTVYYNAGDPQRLTTVGCVMQRLNVRCIYAHSAQAKGRVERSNRTLQDRLLKALRRAKIDSIDEANRFIDQEFLNDVNRRFAHEDHLDNIHRPCIYTSEELLNIFCYTWTRYVYNDYTITLHAQWIQLDRSAGSLPPPCAKVTIRRWLDTSLHIYWNDQELAFHLLNKRPPSAPRPVHPAPMDHPWRTKQIGRAKKKR